MLSVILLVAGCGGESAAGPEGGRTVVDVLAALDGLEGEARTRRLLELVDEEGRTLDLYTSMTSSVLAPVVGAFEEAYGLDVAVYRATSESVLQRLLEESSAGFRGADAVETSGPEIVTLAQKRLLASYRSPMVGALVQGVAHERWTADRFNSFVVSWNTELVSSAEAPRVWDDLADPRWEGTLAIEAADVDWYKTLWEHWVNDEGKSPAEADALFEAIARNAVVVRGHSVMAQLMAAGEYAVGVNYLHIVLNTAADGAPLAWEPFVEPVFPRANGVGVLEAARHPAAGILYMDWLLGAGQDALAEANADPVRRDLAAGGDVERGVVDLEALAAHEEEWTERWDRLLTLGEVTEGGS